MNSDRIKILLVEEFKTTGGEEEVVYYIYRNLDRTKFDVKIACPNDARYFSKNPLDTEDWIPVPMSKQFDLAGIRRLRKEVKAWKFGIVHCHGSRAGFIARLACFGLKNVRVVWTMHANTNDDRVSQSSFKRKIKVFVEYIFNNYLTDGIVFVSNDLMNRTKLSPKSIPLCRTIYNGIDLKRFNYTRLPNYNRGDPLNLLFIGRLSVQKGLDTLIKGISLAVSHGVDLRLQIVGEGELKDKISEQIISEGLSNYVNLTGFKSDVRPYLWKSHLLLLPSRFEGFPMVILESLACGTPVIASNVNGIPEVIENGLNGTLISSVNPFDLSSAIEHYYLHPNDLTSVSRNARNSVLEYTKENMLSNYQKFYFEII